MSGALFRILCSGIACALLAVKSVAAAPSPPPIWSFRAGAPLRAGPGLGGDGVAVGTADGYVHLLRGDGSYRWSFTVKGAVIAPPVIGEGGTVFVATATRRLYALSPNGTLAWTSTLAGTPLSPLDRAADGTLLIATAEGLLYAVTPGGRMRTALAVREPLSAGPLSLDGGWVAGGERGTLFRVEGYSLRRERLASTPLTALSRAGERVLALSDGKLLGLTGLGSARLAWLGCPGQSPVAIDEAGKIARFVAGKLEPLAALGAPASAPPSCLEDGRVLVPHDDGALSVVDPGGRVARHSVGRGALFTPLVDRSREAVIATSVDGRSVALPTGGL